jgi:hypothetical protein
MNSILAAILGGVSGGLEGASLASQRRKEEEERERARLEREQERMEERSRSEQMMQRQQMLDRVMLGERGYMPAQDIADVASQAGDRPHRMLRPTAEQQYDRPEWSTDVSAAQRALETASSGRPTETIGGQRLVQTRTPQEELAESTSREVLSKRLVREQEGEEHRGKYETLRQTYPSASIPEYNPRLDLTSLERAIRERERETFRDRRSAAARQGSGEAAQVSVSRERQSQLGSAYLTNFQSLSPEEQQSFQAAFSAMQIANPREDVGILGYRAMEYVTNQVDRQRQRTLAAGGGGRDGAGGSFSLEGTLPTGGGGSSPVISQPVAPQLSTSQPAGNSYQPSSLQTRTTPATQPTVQRSDETRLMPRSFGTTPIPSPTQPSSGGLESLSDEDLDYVLQQGSLPRSQPSVADTVGGVNLRALSIEDLEALIRGDTLPSRRR